MPSAVAETLSILQASSAKHTSVVVGFSGGKDSLATLDLCIRSFREVSAYFMYLIPDLECVAVELDKAERRWGITIRQYPIPLLWKAIKEGIYCTRYLYGDEEIPEWDRRDVWDLAKEDSGATLVATGAKRADSMWRRRNMAGAGRFDDLIWPLAGWTKLDVKSYLNMRKIEIPDAAKGNATGIGFSTPGILWLHDNHPNDFRKMCELFPFAEAVVWRRTFHGVT